MAPVLGRACAAGSPNGAAAASFREAEEVYEILGTPFFLAVTQLEHAESLERQGPSAEAESLRAAAREIFERLGAPPWLDRATGVDAGEPRVGPDLEHRRQHRERRHDHARQE